MFQLFILLLFAPLSSSSTSLNISLIPNTGYPPTTIFFPSMAEVSSSIYVFGGKDLLQYSNSIYQFNFSQMLWTELMSGSEDLPLPRTHSILFPFGNNLYLYAGQTTQGLSEDLWKLYVNGTRWVKIPQYGDIPSARSQMSYYAAGSQLYVFGGITYDGMDSNLYVLNISNSTWTYVNLNNRPSARSGGKVFQYNNQTYVWGGSVNDSSLYRINEDNLAWEVVNTTGSPPLPRQLFPATVQNGYFYVFPGHFYDMSANIFDCYRIDLSIFKWEQVDCHDINKIYYGYTDLGVNVALFGGVNNSQDFNELVLASFSNTSISLTTVTSDISFPPPRFSHSLQIIRNYLWLFGGESNGEYLNDCWKFNILTELWEFIEPDVSVPPGRKAHAITDVLGDTFFIFGGINSSGYLNDFYLYNFLSNQWIAMNYDNPPNARAGACMTMSYPIIYIYGGYNNDGTLSDFWSLNIFETSFTQIIVNGVSAPPLQNHFCYGKSGYDMIMISGEALYDMNNPNVFHYNASENAWSIIGSDSKFEYSTAGFVVMNTSFIMIGGRKYIEAQQEISQIEGGIIKVIGSLPMPMSSHAVAYAGKNIYAYGGSKIIGKSMMVDRGTSVLLKISVDTFDCSLGFYGENCTICGPGTYSDSFNSKSCSPCSEGTYSGDYGLTDYSQCIPCDQGSFNDKTGSARCFMCLVNENCPVGSIAPAPTQKIPDVVDVQPHPYDTKLSDADSDNYWLIMALEISLSSVFLIYFVFNCRASFEKVDIFTDQHEIDDSEVPYATSWGGLFSIFFAITMLYFVISPALYYAVANITEQKTLVPVFTLDNSIFPAEFMVMTITFYNFGGACENTNNSCSSTITSQFIGIVSEHFLGPFCYMNGAACTINGSCTNCYLKQSSEMTFKIKDFTAYTTGIEVLFQTFSSIPDQPISSLKFYVEPGNDKVFNGKDPTIFYFTTIPSVFYSASSLWPNNITGLHVTYDTKPTLGSTVTPESINSFSVLNINIFFTQSDSALVTSRVLNITIIPLLSAMLGAIAGLLDLMGQIMSVSEKHLTKIKKRFCIGEKAVEVMKCRKKLKDEIKLEKEVLEKIDHDGTVHMEIGKESDKQFKPLLITDKT